MTKNIRIGQFICGKVIDSVQTQNGTKESVPEEAPKNIIIVTPGMKKFRVKR